MNNFEFTFDGTVNLDNSVNAGIKHFSGNAIDCAHCLGTYASQALKLKNEPTAAIIIINAFKKFMELNPQLTEQMMKQLVTDGSDETGFYKKIVPAGMKIIKPKNGKV